MKLSLSKQHKLGSIVFGVFWILFSSIFVIAGLLVSYSSLKKSMWKEVPCEVKSLKVKASLKGHSPFQPIARYTYTVDNTSYTGTQVTDEKDGVDDYGELGKLLYQHKKKQITRCYVNPNDPQEAVLVKPSGWGFLFGLAFATFGAFFVFIGVVIMRQPSKNKETITQKGNREGKDGRAIAIPFFSIFAIAGFVILFFITKSSMAAVSARDWVATPAKVIWSRVISSSSDDGTTYRPEVFFSYQYEGIKHRSNTYRIDKSSSGGEASKRKIVESYPRGKRVTCYVNPEKPYQAIIEQKIGLRWLWLLFPLPFIIVGVGGLIMTLRGKFGSNIGSTSISLRKSKQKQAARSALSGKKSTNASSNSITAAASQEKVILSPGKKRLHWFLGSIALALFWNGIVSIFLKEAIGGWRSGNPDWFLTLFLTPFVLIGFGFILHIPYRFFSMFNPAPKISFPNGAIIIGEDNQITWEIPNGAHKLKQFSILLVGTEEAEYRRGTNTATDHSIFYELEILSTTSSQKSTKGTSQISLPAEATNIMPSWEGDHNSILWTLEVIGEIPLWPDASESYPVTVLPANLFSPSDAPTPNTSNQLPESA